MLGEQGANVVVNFSKSEEKAQQVVSEIAEDCEVLISLDGDRHLQVSGKKDCVRDAMQRLGETFYGKSRFTEEKPSS